MSLEVTALTPASAPVSRPAASPQRPASAVAAADEAPREEISLDRLRQVLETMAAHLEPAQTSLSFRIDDTLNRVVVSIVDSDSGAVLRQIPAEEVLRVAQNLQRYLDQPRGGFLDEVA